MMWLLLSVAGGILYRLGGYGKPFNTKFRDWGVPLVFCAYIWLSGGITGSLAGLSLIVCFFAMWGALTSYKYFLSKPDEYEWYHYALHGFTVAFASGFYTAVIGNWTAFTIRCVLTGVLVGAWSHFVKQDDLEEAGRGFIIIATTPLLFLPF